MKKKIVIIPVYQEHFNEKEIFSLRRTFAVFHEENIVVLTYREILESVSSIIGKIGTHIAFKCFDKFYFTHGTMGYNHLLLSHFFYEAFIEYDYMLICQTDAFPLKNELGLWCRRRYNYLGAPSEYHGEYMCNGGFSLRNIHQFARKSGNVWTFCFSLMRFNHHRIKGKCYAWLHLRSFCKALAIYRGIHVALEVKNEDILWSRMFSDSIPKHDVALQFAFENAPEVLYEENNKQLPFGCHAWYKKENLPFWQKIFKELSSINNIN